MRIIDILLQRYKIYIIHTNSNVYLYKWNMWQLLFPILDAIVGLSKHDAFIQTHQSILGENKYLSFGRMKWNFDNNRKWTTKYLEGADKGDITFFDTEIWAPDWNHCCNKGISPDVFIKLYNDETANFAKEYLVIAISPKLFYKYKDLIENEISKISLLIPHSNISNTIRCWGNGWKIRNNMNDINIQELQEMINQ